MHQGAGTVPGRAVVTRLPVQLHWLELYRLAPHIGITGASRALPPEGAAAVQAIGSADLVVAASPVYKGSYTAARRGVSAARGSGRRGLTAKTQTGQANAGWGHLQCTPQIHSAPPRAAAVASAWTGRVF